VTVGDFEKHCAQRKKYPVLLKIEYNKAIKEAEMQVTRSATKKGNLEKNQNPRNVPCKFMIIKNYKQDFLINANPLFCLIKMTTTGLCWNLMIHLQILTTSMLHTLM